jgi:ferrous iron transport protein A
VKARLPFGSHIGSMSIVCAAFRAIAALIQIQEIGVKNLEDSDPAGRVAGATLDAAAIGQPLAVEAVLAPDAAPEWARWLEEIGFIVGERVMLMARALPGGDPLVVRVGQSTFALRRAEAACVGVVPMAAAVPSGGAVFPVLEGSRA